MNIGIFAFSRSSVETFLVTLTGHCNFMFSSPNIGFKTTSLVSVYPRSTPRRNHARLTIRTKSLRPL